MRAETVGVRDLKLKLGSYLDRVRAGGRVIVTHRGRPIAEVRPIAPDHGDESVLRRLAEHGLITRGEGRLTAFKPVKLSGGPLSATILEDRDDRT